MTVLNAVKVAAAIDGRAACEATLVKRTHAAAAIAALNAESVDLEARFPAEAFEAIRAQRLLSAMIPEEFGGDGAEMSEIADICYQLGRSCGSTGMIYAMHQTKLACILRHGSNSKWHRHVLKDVCDKQLLLASSTTEGQRGGNIRSSDAAIQRNGEAITLERAATVISYGEEADGLVTTARRSEESLTRIRCFSCFSSRTTASTRSWAGTPWACAAPAVPASCSEANGRAEQILPEAYEKIHGRTMLPTAHLLWGSVWTGIAAAAVERARLFLRKAAASRAEHAARRPAFHPGGRPSAVPARPMLNSALRRYERYACR